MMKLLMHNKLLLWFLVFVFPLAASAGSEEKHDQHEPEINDPIKLDNPMSVQYLKKNLRKSTPRLILTPSIERNLKKDLRTDPVVQNMYEAIKLNAQEIQTEPLLKRELEGRRLLGVSREMLYRMNILGIVYRIDRDEKVLNRINDELIAVCDFQDWNPSHYLDVAEMAMAVALAVDWAGEDLPASTVELAKSALIEKGIMPSYNEDGNVGWISGNNNWNQVCNGGMIAASIAIAEEDPELASQTIARALDGIPHALEEYGPDGVYPEGSTYWSYGTSFSVLTASMLESAFDTDFGLAEYPAFMESADFRVLSVAPSGWYYNFADCGDQRSETGDLTLAWFAKKTGNETYFEEERFLQSPEDMGKLARYAGAGLVWLSQFEEETDKNLPEAWMGEGSNPVVFFRDEDSNYYFGGKGGRGTVNHGNMDAGSFIFELDGVRWIVDPGNQSYHELEKTGFDLWDRCQDCERWTLLTKNNYGHSTLTVNDKLHHVDGFASIADFKEGENPEATIDMTEVFGEDLASASRRFAKEDDNSLLIEDQFQTNENTKNITWQLMTTADVEIVDGGAILRQEGKSLKLENLSHPELTVSIISLDPPPLQLDRTIDNLKRLEIRMPAYLFPEKEGELRVRLSAAD
ncbi:heparinase II/III family protein [Catalinimonas sp. 4WD22]|uniref:heparinase II/III domain-containing protein n=1 Tax=Catalinimonas locisalis TaxID=3133978 RepID=UPI003101B047